MGVAETDCPLEAQKRQPAGQTQQMGEVFVGLLLPATRPHELEVRDKGEQVCGSGDRKEVGYAFDRMERPFDGRSFGACKGSEERDHPIDVHEQQRPIA